MISIAGAVLVSKTGSLLLQRRDDNPAIFSPNMISIFGGSAETDESNLLEVAMREIEEETGLSPARQDFLPLVNFNNIYPDGRNITGSFYILKNIEPSALKITEGSLIEIPISQAGNFMHEMVPTTCFAISIYLQSIKG